MKKKTHDEFIQEMNNINPNIIILGKYENSKAKIKCECKICGSTWEATPNNLLKGHGCPKCKALKVSERCTKSLELIILEFLKVHNFYYDYSKVKYVNGRSKVYIICPKHGEFLLTPDAHLHGEGCPKCYEERRGKWGLKTTKQFILEAKLIHGDKYNYSKVNYINGETPVTIICPMHGEFLQKPTIHLMGSGCIKCSGKEIFNAEQFIEKAKAVHGDKYDYSKVEYVNTDSKVTIICKQHGEFLQTPHTYIYKKSGCPKCQLSHGESLIELYLKLFNIKYISQYLINLDTLKAYIDFYLPEYNTFIEYNGILHYIPVKYFGGELLFEKQQLRDNLVKEYCDKNNIKLLEIPYTLSDDQIIQLLKENYVNR